jgi:acyl carrier protein
VSLFTWFRRRQPRGLHWSPAAAHWASTRFPPHLQPVAAFVGEILCEQLHIPLSVIEPSTQFATDLRMDELEPVELVMALEEDLGIVIPDEDCAQLQAVADLISYLYRRVSEDTHRALP